MMIGDALCSAVKRITVSTPCPPSLHCRRWRWRVGSRSSTTRSPPQPEIAKRRILPARSSPFDPVNQRSQRRNNERLPDRASVILAQHRDPKSCPVSPQRIGRATGQRMPVNVGGRVEAVWAAAVDLSITIHLLALLVNHEAMS